MVKKVIMDKLKSHQIASVRRDYWSKRECTAKIAWMDARRMNRADPGDSSSHMRTSVHESLERGKIRATSDPSHPGHATCGTLGAQCTCHGNNRKIDSLGGDP